MKLLYCSQCFDVVALRPELERVCACGRCRGRYFEDELHAWISGPAIPLGFANTSLTSALSRRPPPGAARGELFTAFVIERGCPTVEERGEIREGSKRQYARKPKRDTR